MRAKLKERFRQGRGQNVKRFIRETLNPLLRGWMNYFRLSETKRFAEEVDGWVRRRLRGVLWRQCKPPATRYWRLRALGLDEARVLASAITAGARGSIAVLPTSMPPFRRRRHAVMGLINLLATPNSYANSSS